MRREKRARQCRAHRGCLLFLLAVEDVALQLAVAGLPDETEHGRPTLVRRAERDVLQLESGLLVLAQAVRDGQPARDVRRNEQAHFLDDFVLGQFRDAFAADLRAFRAVIGAAAEIGVDLFHAEVSDNETRLGVV